MFTVSVVLVFAVTHLVRSQDVPIVKTPLGKVQGHYLVSNEGNKYKAFEGIPFALPPTGLRRFLDPEPVEPWPGVLIANKFRESCMSARNLLPTGRNVTGVEDCLYLNVYTPLNATIESLPVIFFIYGGAFTYSSLSGTEQHYLIDHDIVFVSMNHRQSILGFLSTEDNIVSGNMGLKDQVLCLRWVSENIRYFGGDPKQVTITGFSSGGQSIHYHYLSPLTAGLFQAGISFSGTALASTAQTENSRGKAIKLGELLNCPTDDVREMIECLRNRSAYEITAAQDYFQPWHHLPYVPFGPVVEKSAKKPFIDRSPIDIIRSGDAHPVPWITGVTSEEGLYPLSTMVLNETAIEELNNNWESLAPHLLDYVYTIPKDQRADIARSIRKFYLGDKPINKENFLTLTHLVSDRIFISDAVKAAKEQAIANRAPVWFYYYSYRATDSVSDVLSNSKENFGVCHGDDVFLATGNPFISPNKSTTDLAMNMELVKFWLSVAYKKKPYFGPKWTKINPKKSKFNYLHISGPEDFKLETNDDLGEFKFWNSLGFNENKICSQ